jgi:hypothetical protein
MTLEISQIVDLIQNPANKDLIDESRKYSDKCNLHVNGKDIDKFFELIKHYENEQQLALRKKYSRSNKYIFNEMLRPLDKIFSARGGAKYYNIGGSDYKDEIKFRQILSDVRNGLSLDKWNQKVWLKKRIVDPNGILLLETSKDGRNCYPTYKSIYSILDYQYSGLKIEYVIFEPEVDKEGVKRYRVIDDKMDYIFIEQPIVKDANQIRNISVSDEESFPHGYDKFPGIMIADTEDDLKGFKTSFIDNVIELAEEILVDNSVKIIFKFTQGFPAYWEIERSCSVCKGSGKIEAKDCPHCLGTGVRTKKDISDKIIVTMDETGKAGAIPPAGYVSADIGTWEMMNKESELMSKLLHKSMWGTLAMISEKIYQTATGVVGDLQPVYDRLSPISSEAENIEKFFTDLMGKFYFRNLYKGSTIIYGKRFQIESPDQLLEKLAKAKQGNVPSQTVKNIYMEYLQSMYSNDIMEMSLQIKIFKLDLFPVFTVNELKDIGFPLEELYKKLLFDQWIVSLSNDKILTENLETLTSERDDYINLKIKSNATLQRNSQDAGGDNPQRQAV